MRWRAYYTNGRVYDSRRWAWQSLPAEGLVGVVIYEEPPYRRILDGFDWAWLEDGEVHVTGTHPEWGKWLDPPDVECSSCLKRGAALPDEEFYAIQRRMMGAR